MIYELIDLEAVEEKEIVRIANLLNMWQVYFASQNRDEEKQTVIDLLEELKQYNQR